MEQTETATLDVRGEICPYPMLRTNRELDESDPKPNALEVITDHPPALSTIPPEAMKRVNKLFHFKQYFCLLYHVCYS